MDKELQVEVAAILQRGEDLANAQRVEGNIVATIEQLEICLPLFKMYQKLRDQLAQRRCVLSFVEDRRLKIMWLCCLIGITLP